MPGDGRGQPASVLSWGGLSPHTLPAFRTTTDGLALVRPGPKAHALFEIWAGGTWIRREGEKEGQRHQQHQCQCHHNH